MPPPSLLEATSSISFEKGSLNRFTTHITHDWCTQHSVLGGYLVALTLSAAHKYLDTELTKNKYSDSIHIFTQFLHMVPPGPVSISCRTLSTTSRLCVVQVTLEPAHPQPPPLKEPKAQESPACIAIATFADLSKETGLTLSTPILPTPLPNREIECLTINDPIIDSTPVTRKLNWVAPRSAYGLWGHRLGGHNREVWLSFEDGSKIDDLQVLAFLADLPLQPPATHTPPAIFYSRHALSTLCISVEFKKRPGPNTKCVLVRSNSQQVVRGRYDVDVQILDENGGVLVLSRHVVFVLGLRGRI
ncbi:thioesterase-like superfamily-domain-containing protein [Aspergillus cavernicola]|uniref:Thioesterase-like superfamily-domain-containing protein n=1 Tax=Aspergillus cavernicola TaxID=176166 RepID=A0ABR4I1Z4_9EURO